jgi:hypothetical protein
MRERYLPSASTAEFYRKRILPEEVRRNRIPTPIWNSGFRWFTSPNIVDLWDYRNSGERQRIAAYMWGRQFGHDYLADDMQKKAE